jgi:hypothetical protein
LETKKAKNIEDTNYVNKQNLKNAFAQQLEIETNGYINVKPIFELNTDSDLALQTVN